MKRSTISILMTAGLLAAFCLSGCRLGGGTEGEAAGSVCRRERMFPSQRPVLPENRCRNPKVNQETEEDAQEAGNARAAGTEGN
ncbi:MAG: hypothetical protein ACLTW9_00685 [Enterocloster sp.]